MLARLSPFSMPLTPGQTLTHYEILGPLGAGGMGEVYSARDTRLEREVAIKVLPEHFADDEERLRRFEREAKTLASLNHTNVAGIHGIDRVGDTCFLAMELVPGEDLATKLARGALPIDEAVDVCSQIAEGLEAAHEAGVVHRDLKPANVRVTPEGVVKILDFGLAKPIGPSAPGGPNDRTTTAHPDSYLMTADGLILGTPTYMSPEQARGKPIDRRTDVWAFGCVLYECLTGRRAFAGGSLSDVIAAVIEREPDWSRLPAAVPADVRHLLRRCLRKDPRVRLRDVGEARVVLAGEAEVEDPRAVPVGAKGALLAFAAGLAVAGVAWLGVTLLRPDAVVGPGGAGKALHMTLAWGPDDRLSSISISPDGDRLLFTRDGALWIRDLAKFEPRPLPGADGADKVAWSPDGDAVAFTRRGGLEVLDLRGTRPQRRCEMGNWIGNLSWGDDGSFLIEVRRGQNGVHLLAPDSSVPEYLDWLGTADVAMPQGYHPCFLPGSEEFLVTLGELGDAWIHVASLKTRSTRKLVRATSKGVYVHPGWLAWVEEGRLLVQPFDAATATLSGAPHELVGDVLHSDGGRGYFNFSREGTLSYQPWGGPAQIEWVDREGRPLGSAGSPRQYRELRLDPTGRFLATSIAALERGAVDLWSLDLARDTPLRLTHESGWVGNPVWSRDGTEIAFSADPHGAPNIYVKNADGGATREIVPFSTPSFGGSWTPDGRSLLYHTQGDIWSVDVSTLERRRLLETPFREQDVQLSPDGKWLAYTSDESGRREVYLASFPDLTGRRRVSSAGGDQPRWRIDSGELFFRTENKVIASVTIAVRDGRAEPERETIVIQASKDLDGFDVAPDGSRFLLLRANEDAIRPVSHVITQWQRLLRE